MKKKHDPYPAKSLDRDHIDQPLLQGLFVIIISYQHRSVQDKEN